MKLASSTKSARNNGPIDWQSLREAIVAGLNIEAEYESLGIRWAKGKVSSNGWRDCHAIDREDSEPSACVNLQTGLYRDRSGNTMRGFLRVALDQKVAETFSEVLKIYAEKAGVSVPKFQLDYKGDIHEETYVYHEANGFPIYEALRYLKPDGSKTFKMRSYAPSGGHIHGIEGIEPVPYRLPELNKSAVTGDIVYILEGEKDVNRAYKEGLTATTNHTGTAASNHWKTLAKWMIGRHVVILADNDWAGWNHAVKVAKHIESHAASIKVIEIPGALFKGDFSDYLDSGHELSEFLAIANEAPLWNPEQKRTAKTDSRDPNIPKLKPGETLEIEVVEDDSDGPNKSPSGAIEADLDSHRLARVHLERHATYEGMPTLKYYDSEYHQWKKSDAAWRIIGKNEVQSSLVSTIKEIHDEIAIKLRKPSLSVTTSELNNACQALKSLALLKLHDCPSHPAWLDQVEGRPDPIDILPAKNALIDMARFMDDPSGSILPLTPMFFSPNNIGYECHLDAPPPKHLLAFLESIWGDDHESIDTLQEWFGYCISPSTPIHKMLMIVGASRAGKGSIKELLESLVGKRNTVGTTLSEIGKGGFKIQPLIGKSLWVIGDSRISGRADSQSIIEQLLSISGEDSTTIDRKNSTAWTGTLTTRIVLMSNLLPQLGDASGALNSRFITLYLRKSFLGKEDIHMREKLKSELPSTLLWAMVGRKRLLERGRFIQPESGKEIAAEFDDLTNPVGSFIQSECELIPMGETLCFKLYERWCEWCKFHGREHPGNSQTFGRNLRASAPGIDTRQHRIEGGDRTRSYVGITLRSAF